MAQHVQGYFKAEWKVSEQIDAAKDAEALHGINIAERSEKRLSSMH